MPTKLRKAQGAYQNDVAHGVEVAPAAKHEPLRAAKALRRRGASGLAEQERLAIANHA